MLDPAFLDYNNEWSEPCQTSHSIGICSLHGVANFASGNLDLRDSLLQDTMHDTLNHRLSFRDPVLDIQTLDLPYQAIIHDWISIAIIP